MDRRTRPRPALKVGANPDVGLAPPPPRKSRRRVHGLGAPPLSPPGGRRARGAEPPGACSWRGTVVALGLGGAGEEGGALALLSLGEEPRQGEAVARAEAAQRRGGGADLVDLEPRQAGTAEARGGGELVEGPAALEPQRAQPSGEAALDL